MNRTFSFLLLLLFFFNPYNTFAQPCQDYTCDSLVVRKILDTNGFDTVSVASVSWKNPSGRIDSVKMCGIGILNNKLNILPAEIGNLTALTWLNLSSNKLTSLPSEIGNLSALTWLNLYYNQLTSLPPEIGDLTALTELRLAVNQLTSVPSEIGNLTVLTELFLSNLG